MELAGDNCQETYSCGTGQGSESYSQTLSIAANRAPALSQTWIGGRRS